MSKNSEKNVNWEPDIRKGMEIAPDCATIEFRAISDWPRWFDFFFRIKTVEALRDLPGDLFSHLS